MSWYHTYTYIYRHNIYIGIMYIYIYTCMYIYGLPSFTTILVCVSWLRVSLVQSKVQTWFDKYMRILFGEVWRGTRNAGCGVPNFQAKHIPFKAGTTELDVYVERAGMMLDMVSHDIFVIAPWLSDVNQIYAAIEAQKVERWTQKQFSHPSTMENRSRSSNHCKHSDCSMHWWPVPRKQTNVSLKLTTSRCITPPIFQNCGSRNGPKQDTPRYKMMKMAIAMRRARPWGLGDFPFFPMNSVWHQRKSGPLFICLWISGRPRSRGPSL